MDMNNHFGYNVNVDICIKLTLGYLYSFCEHIYSKLMACLIKSVMLCWLEGKVLGGIAVKILLYCG